LTDPGETLSSTSRSTHLQTKNKTPWQNYIY
jgi:hypothetical protein